MNFVDDRIFSTLFTCDCSEMDIDLCWNPAALELPADMQHDVQKHWAALPKGHIFNGRLARLDTWSRNSTGYRLELSPSDYRTLMYSNNHIQHICKTWGNTYLSRALGISAVLVSSDDYTIFMKRSSYVGEYPGCYDVFGGHVDVPANGAKPCVFSAMAQELEEEAGLDRSDYDLKLVGLVETTAHQKPELVFLATAFLEKKDILSRASEAKDHIEFTQVHTLENRVELIEQFLKANKQNTSPSALGSLCVYMRKSYNDVRDSRGSE